MHHHPFRTTLSCAVALLFASPAWSQTELYSFPGTPHHHLGTNVEAAGDVDGDGVGDMMASVFVGYVQVFSGADGSVLHTFNDGAQNFYRPIDSAGDVNGDGHADLLVADPSDDTNGLLSGTVKVYSGANGQALYTLSGAEQDEFGSAVAGTGDVDHDGFADFAVAASIFHSDTAPYVKIFSGQDASVIHTLEPDVETFVGSTLAAPGDLSGDGTGDLLVGAPLDGVLVEGSVRAYSLGTGTLIYKIGGGNLDQFGTDIDAGGDVNGDQVPEFIVGAPSGPGSGSAAYARVCSGINGKKIFDLEGDDDDNITDFYGVSVAHAGDVNGDGIDDHLVGAPVEDKGHLNSGRAWLYSGKTGGVLYAFDGQLAGAELGTTVAIIPDLNGDGRADILVGAPEDDGPGPDAGRVLVYSGNDLFHFAEPHEIAAGQTLKHRTSEGAPAAPTILVVTDVSGVPTFLIVGGIAFFDGTGKREFSVTVPPGLTGLTITHRAFALTPAGFVIDSAGEVVTFL